MEDTTIDIIPLGGRLIVKQERAPEYVGNIYIPENTKEMVPTEGIVVRIGEDVDKVSVGDKVYYGRYAGFSFERKKINYVFLNQDDILGKIITEKEER